MRFRKNFHEISKFSGARKILKIEPQKSKNLPFHFGHFGQIGQIAQNVSKFAQNLGQIFLF